MGLSALAAVAESITQTPSKTQKVERASSYLRSLPREEAERAALFLTGRAFSRSDETVLSVGGTLMWQAIADLTGCSPTEMQAAYRRHGDLGGMTDELFRGRVGEPVSLVDVERALASLARMRGMGLKLRQLKALLARLGPLEAKYVVKIISGELRIGLRESMVEEAIAKAFNEPLADVQRANMLLGDIRQTLREAAQGRLGEARFKLFLPVACMLASAADSPEDLAASFAAGAWVEDKYDGIRAQAHKAVEKVKFFSRTLDEVVEFYELTPTLKRLPGEFVLDGEIIGWRDGRPLPFSELQQRLGRKQPDLWWPSAVPVRLVAFDLLYLDGEALFNQPLADRRARLSRLLSPTVAENGSLIQLIESVAASRAEEFEAAFQAALAHGNEGLVAKAPDSAYLPGRRGRAWLKLKRPMATLDVVVTAVEYGHGKRYNVLSDYTFSVRKGEQLVTIGKAYSGLTDTEIVESADWFKQHTLRVDGHLLQVEPKIVVEVAFNNIQKSDRHASGYALRFPRILRLRPDKTAAEIDSLERVQELYARQARGSWRV